MQDLLLHPFHFSLGLVVLPLFDLLLTSLKPLVDQESPTYIWNFSLFLLLCTSVFFASLIAFQPDQHKAFPAGTFFFNRLSMNT